MNFHRRRHPHMMMQGYGEPADLGYYGEPIEYYGEDPGYGYYGEPYYGFGEADYGDYGESEPVGYYAAAPEMVGWGMGEDPGGMGCACGPGPGLGCGGCSCGCGGMHGYGDYGAYVPDLPPRSIPHVIAATNLNEYGDPGYGYYGESEYGEPGHGESSYGEPEHTAASYGEPGYGESDFGESDYGAYMAPRDTNPTCGTAKIPKTSHPVPDNFRPYF